MKKVLKSRKGIVPAVEKIIDKELPVLSAKNEKIRKLIF